MSESPFYSFGRLLTHYRICARLFSMGYDEGLLIPTVSETDETFKRWRKLTEDPKPLTDRSMCSQHSIIMGADLIAGHGLFYSLEEHLAPTKVHYGSASTICLTLSAQRNPKAAVAETRWNTTSTTYIDMKQPGVHPILIIHITCSRGTVA